MTVSYSYEASNAGLLTPLRLLCKWRGSALKYVWRELVLYFATYFAISATYRFVLGEEQKMTFEALVIFADSYTTMIPTTFILGFYVNIVFYRWNHVFDAIAWPDEVCLDLATYLAGRDERSRLLRRTVARYLIAAEVLTLRDISMAVRKRFPSLQHVSDAGLLSGDELALYEGLDDSHPRYWAPIQWGMAVVARAKEEGKITSDFLVTKINSSIMAFKGKLGSLLCYDSVGIPLVYTQIVWLAVWTYFVAALISRQYLDPAAGHDKFKVDLYFPPFLFLQFIFFMGWLKVAECMLNPLGEDDDDFELNAIIDRNYQVALMQLDQNAGVVPELRKDPFWDVDVVDLPHTVASWGKKDTPIHPSCSQKDVSKTGARVLNDAEVLVRRKSRASNWTLGTRVSRSFRRNQSSKSDRPEDGSAAPPHGKRSFSENTMVGGVTQAEAREMAREMASGRVGVPDSLLFSLAEETPDHKL